MTNNLLDLRPFYRNSVGLDRIFDRLNQLSTVDSSYPPYNVEKLEDDKYVISMAVAGFSEEDIDVTYSRGTVSVKGKVREESTQERTYLYRGIATRTFERTFTLEDYIEVTNAEMKNGMLMIYLHRNVPEKEKPKLIKINKS